MDFVLEPVGTPCWLFLVTILLDTAVCATDTVLDVSGLIGWRRVVIL
ncbi:hypothetical protein L3V77_21680 [Vibrio sp. DW001]|nr:hypothetical protein [Vibrio sp. DW001]WED28559.1 hypothetical protein L3V77_21680 [Vibrio sp. DW001]